MKHTRNKQYFCIGITEVPIWFSLRYLVELVPVQIRNKKRRKAHVLIIHFNCRKKTEIILGRCQIGALSVLFELTLLIQYLNMDIVRINRNVVLNKLLHSPLTLHISSSRFLRNLRQSFAIRASQLALLADAISLRIMFLMFSAIYILLLFLIEEIIGTFAWRL